MNETASLLLATTVLALGGLGLFLLKEPQEEDKVNEDDNKIISNEDTAEEYDDDEYDVKTKKNNKTKKNKKTSGSKRRY
jgi:hypothetical protein